MVMRVSCIYWLVLEMFRLHMSGKPKTYVAYSSTIQETVQTKHEDPVLNRQQRIRIEQKIQAAIFFNFTVFQRHATAVEVLDTFVKIVEDDRQSISAFRAIISDRVTTTNQTNQ